MATSKRNPVGVAASAVADAATSLADAVSKQMPGWKLATSSASSDALGAVGDSQEAQQGVDVATLRKKFLAGRSSSADALRTRNAPARSATQVEVFKVEPASGGPAQVAERRNGKITIVSG